MKRLTLAFAVALGTFLITRTALAELAVVVTPSNPLSRRILFVVDTSASMLGHFPRALQAVAEVASQPTDELEIGVISFNDTVARWPGFPEDDLPQGWARLPDLKAVESVGQWLERQGARGGTRVVPALRLALEEPRQELSVVLVTDGRFVSDEIYQLPGLVESLQGERCRQGQGPAVILVYGVGREMEHLRELGRQGAGGYYLESMADQFGQW